MVCFHKTMLKFGEQVPLLAYKEVKKVQKAQGYTKNMEDASNINSFGLWSWAVNGYSSGMKFKKKYKKERHPSPDTFYKTIENRKNTEGFSFYVAGIDRSPILLQRFNKAW